MHPEDLAALEAFRAAQPPPQPQPPRRCMTDKCPYPAVKGRSRCYKCGSSWDKKPRSRDAAYRGDWPALRERVLKEQQTCQLRLPGCTVVSTEVDHIHNVGSGGGNDPSNLQAVCASCHRKKTHAESNAGKRRRHDGGPR
jgi:hypothetical protein